MNRTVNIDDLMGIPYQENGRGNPGYDCYGYAIEVCKRCGKELPDVEGSKDSDRNFVECLERGLKLGLVKEVDSPVEQGDLVFFKDLNGVLYHIGVYLGDGYVTHCNCHGSHTEKLNRKQHFIGRCFTWLQ